MRRRFGLLVAMLATTSAAQTVSTPNWLQRPSAIQITSGWPVAAMDVKRARVQIQCRISSQGLLEACQVLSADPPNKGFEDAALNLADQFRAKPGDRAGAVITLPIDFRSSGERPRRIEGEISDLVWAKTPSWQQMQDAFPAAAKVDAGDVLLRCKLVGQGTLGDCRTVAESPRRQGFDAAARSLTAGFEAWIPDALMPSMGFVDTLVAFHFVRPGGARSLTAPPWVHRIGLEDAEKMFPAAARAAGVTTGQARLRCDVQADGHLKNCLVLEESPANLGFAQVALSLSAELAMNPWVAPGFPADGLSLTFPIQFGGP